MKYGEFLDWVRDCCLLKKGGAQYKGKGHPITGHEGSEVE